jgi:hypothetical protein
MTYGEDAAPMLEALATAAEFLFAWSDTLSV